MLAEKLMESVEDFATPEVEAAWDAEVESRVMEIREGRAEGSPKKNSMKRVAYHRLAAAELIESARFYDRRRRGLGDEFLSAMAAVRESIRTQPDRGRRALLGTFSFRPKRFPFRIIYEIQPDRCWIVAAAHLSGRPGYWARRI